MTISNTTRSITYAGAIPASSGPFSFPFKIFGAAHLEVMRISPDNEETLLVNGVDFSTTGVGEASGAVLLVDALPISWSLRIRRAPALTQELSIRDQGSYFPSDIEDRFDLLVMQVQGAIDGIANAAQDLSAFPVPTLSEMAEPNDTGGLLQWTSGISYEIQIALNEDFDILVPQFENVIIEDPTELQFLIGFLYPSTDYWVRLRAVKGTTYGNWSLPIQFTTDDPFVCQGGSSVTFDGVYSTHLFEVSDDFEVLSGAQKPEMLLVAGGGAGGYPGGTGVSGGGGGGGGVRHFRPTDINYPFDDLTPGVYPVTVGMGGQATNVTAPDGGRTYFNGVDKNRADGGGGGGRAGGTVGEGGSGGGAVNAAGGPESGGRGRGGHGYDGGGANAGSGGGGGGGGALEEGDVGTALVGGDGGDGYETDIDNGVNRSYGAGGGGGRPVDAFGPIVGTFPGQGPGGGNGASVAGPGSDATNYGAGGGGAIHGAAYRGGHGYHGVAFIKYRGRAADITPDPEVLTYRGPILMTGCTRRQTVGGVNIDIDCNARIDSGVYPDYLAYDCIGAGVFKSSRCMQAASLPSQLPNDVLVGGENAIHGGTLVFRFSDPIRAFKITRRVTAGTTQTPLLMACDDYTVVPHPTSTIPGSSRDGSIFGLRTISPQVVSYPDPLNPTLDPSVNLAVQEDMIIINHDGFLCVVITQNDTHPSEFINPKFVLLTD